MKKIYSWVGVFIICFIFGGFQGHVWSEERIYTLYKTENNEITCEVKESELNTYINNSYEWSIGPTTLMYSADGRTTYILNSEVDNYKTVGWSTLPPVVIYKVNGEQSVLQEEVSDYLATGIWFRTKEEALPPVNITMNIFEKTNLSADELNKILSKGLSGYGEAFYNMEQKYGINSIFAISVAELESGSGTSYAFRNKNNAFGIGPGRYFNSVNAGIEFFGQLMNKPLYYGKSISAVGSIYCVGGNWANKVKALMNNNYSGLGY